MSDDQEDSERSGRIGADDTRKISPWGNSLGIRIPDDVINETAFGQGEPVTVQVVDADTVVIKRVETDDGEGDR